MLDADSVVRSAPRAKAALSRYMLGDRPHLERLVFAARGDGLAVRRESYTMNGPVVSCQLGDRHEADLMRKPASF